MIKQIRIILERVPTLTKSSWWQGRLSGLGLATVFSLLAGCAAVPSGPAAPVVPPPAEAARKPVRIGLALGGGAARGFAHVGVIAVLEEAGLKPQLVVGTSAGSLVAALYASGKTSAQLQQTALNMEEVAITDWMLPIFGRGMFRGDALARYVNDLVANRLMENMAIPLGIVATDLNSGQAVLFQRGDTGTAVRASSAVPAVFVPVKINGREYVDGGLVSPVPVRFARQMGADIVVAVDISSPPEANPAGDTLQILLQTFAIMGKSINQYELKDADVVVRPSLAGLKSADFSARQRAIDSGRAAMLAALPQLKARLEAAGGQVQRLLP
ncbi:NTE family protein [Polaromonas sp. YR568]|uniref:patatin-like phospholipase family protein n=1 Tax=Polaromonas sp. YR568 TaxID=1855301 RepID=UPI0008E094C1|nr:patatin-like phospholipase family protein [Polaromonas sp. YR568]SFU35379.1 NTE family protein [Polaromonas sp. YR568]